MEETKYNIELMKNVDVVQQQQQQQQLHDQQQQQMHQASTNKRSATPPCFIKLWVPMQQLTTYPMSLPFHKSPQGCQANE